MAEWYSLGLRGFGGRVDQLVPAGFEAYARILHPVESPDEASMGMEPSVGNLKLPELECLVKLLLKTAGAGRCWLTVWDGTAGIPAEWHNMPTVHQINRDYYLFECPLRRLVEFCIELERVLWGDAEPGSAAPAVGTASGTVSAAELPNPEAGTMSQSPNQWWAADHSWCVATGVDLDSTLVGGSASLIEQILESPGLEALPIEPSVDLVKL